VTGAKHTTLLLALGACLVASGCGSEEGAGIPAESASALQGQLDSIQGRFESPGGVACADITGGDDPNTTVVQQNIEALPDDVDPDVRDALEQSFEHLFELVDEQCEVAEPEPEPEPAPVEPEPEPVPTETTETTETTPPPTEPEPVPTTPTEPDQGGDGQLPDGGESGEGGTGGEGGATGGAGGAGGGAVVPEDSG
jgi:hypothetical protein